MAMGTAKDALACCCVVLAVVGFICSIAVAVVYGCTVPFRASVDEASLALLALTGAPGNNSTPASLAYDLALVVALRINKQACGVSHAAPLDAELRFLGRPFARARMAGAEWEAVGEVRNKVLVYRQSWQGENATLALRPDEVAAFTRESAAGVFEVELVVAGEFKSPVRFEWCRISVSCPLRLSVSTAAAPAPFERVKCASS